MSQVEVPDSLMADLRAEFGDAAGQVVEHALRSEITRHRIEQALKDGEDPAAAVAAALSRDPGFLASVDALPERLESGESPSPDALEDRLRRWG